MAAPTIVWRQCTGSAASVAYASIASLNFGTVTAGAWSYLKVVRPKVTVNSIQSCKWWLSDIGAQRSGASVSLGTGAGWVHKFKFSTAAPAACSATKASAVFGTESPESSGSAASYAAVAPNNYGNFIVLALKVASAAGDGATTAWGYQLNWATNRVIYWIKSVKFGETFKMVIPSEVFNYLKKRVETIRQIPLMWGKDIVQTTNSFIEVAKATVVRKYSYT